MTFLDTNAWLGEWPFTGVACRDVASLSACWRRHGIGGGWVSSLASLWPLDPMPANRALRAALNGKRAIMPLPVLNPLAPDWTPHLSELADWRNVRAVRLAPGYGGWSLASRAGCEATRAIAARGLRVVLTARLVDERHEHPSLRVKPVPVAAIVRWLDEVPECRPLIQGLTRWEIEELAGTTDRFFVDLSFAEWADTIAVVGRSVSPRRIVFGSLTPLHVARAQVDKVARSPAAAATRAAIARHNAERFLRS